MELMKKSNENERNEENVEKITRGGKWREGVNINDKIIIYLKMYQQWKEIYDIEEEEMKEEIMKKKNMKYNREEECEEMKKKICLKWNEEKMKCYSYEIIMKRRKATIYQWRKYNLEKRARNDLYDALLWQCPIIYAWRYYLCH